MSETHEFLVKGWLFAKDAKHGKNALQTPEGGFCIFGAYLAGNGIDVKECQDFYPPYTGELAKFNAGATLLQKVVPSGRIPKFNDHDWTDRSHMVAIFRLAIKNLEEIEGIFPSALLIHEKDDFQPNQEMLEKAKEVLDAESTPLVFHDTKRVF